MEEDYAYLVRKDLLARLPPDRRQQLVELCRDHNGRGGPVLFSGAMGCLQQGGEGLLDDVMAAMARCEERIVETQPTAAAAAAAEQRRRWKEEAGHAAAAAQEEGGEGVTVEDARAAAGAAAGQGTGLGGGGGPKKRQQQVRDGDTAPVSGPFPWTMGGYEWTSRPEPMGPPPSMQPLPTPAHQHHRYPHQQPALNGYHTGPHSPSGPSGAYAIGGSAHASPTAPSGSSNGGGILQPPQPPEVVQQRDHMYGPVQLCCFDMAHRYEFGLETTPVSAAFKPFPRTNPPSGEEVDHAYPVTPPQLLRYMRAMLDK
mgnify:CR=1 FL=1